MSGLLQDYIDGAAPITGLHGGINSDEEMGKSVAIDMIRILPGRDGEFEQR